MKEEKKENDMPGGCVDVLLWSAFNILCGIQGAQWLVFRYGGGGDWVIHVAMLLAK